jgi:hypothetical protein
MKPGEIAYQGALGNQCPLGIAGGATGVNQDGRVFCECFSALNALGANFFSAMALATEIQPAPGK